MECPRCRQANASEQKFCGECGFQLLSDSIPNGAKGLTNAPGNYTPRHLADRIFNSRSALQGERKQVTVLFGDVSESTQMAERLGAERMHGVLNAFFEVALAYVHRFEGTVNQFLGDGFMALFGAPVTHEDHARRAVLAALGIRDEIASATSKYGLPKDFQIRLGLHTGFVVVGNIGDNLRMDYTAVGDTTNTAARLQGAAEPGTIVISEDLRRHIRNFVELKALEPRLLKGKAEPVPLYEVVRAFAGPRRNGPADSALIGREVELTLIEESLGRLSKGQGGILTITGDAGLGKSALLAAARNFASKFPLEWVDGSCVSFGRTLSYLPFRDVLRSCFEIAENDDQERSLDKLRAGLDGLFGLERDEILPYVAAVLGLQLPESLAQRVNALDRLAVGPQVFRTSLRLFERLAMTKPLAVVLEDWHWADASSAELLEHLLTLTGRAPILFVVTSRPYELGPAASLRSALAASESLRAFHRPIDLKPLSDGAAQTLITNLLDGGSLPPSLQDRLIRQAEGNPFYLGELVRVLISKKAIHRGPHSVAWEITDRLTHIELPDSIEGVILARVDRLNDECKQVLKTAAAIGRSFFYSVLHGVVDNPSRLDLELDQLKTAELVQNKRETPELELMFSHPLIQQATYSTLLEEHRRQLHFQVAQCIEKLFAMRVDEFSAVLAYHYARAEQWDRAQHFLLRAGDQAGRIAADAEALDHYEQALETSRMSAQGLDRFARADLQTRIGEALFRLGHHEAAVEHALSALSAIGVRYPTAPISVRIAIAVKVIARGARRIWKPLRSLTGPKKPAALGSTKATMARALEVVANVDYSRNPERFVLHVLNAVELAEEQPRSREYIVGVSALGLICDLLGMYRLAATLHQKAGQAGDELGDDIALGYCRLLKGGHEIDTGRWAAADTTLRGSEAHFRASGHLRNWCAARSVRVCLHRTMGDPQWVQEVQEMLAIAVEAKVDQGVAWATQWMGLSHLDRGDYSAAFSHLDKARAIYESVTDYSSQVGTLAQCALCLIELRRLDEAFVLLKQAQLNYAKYRLSGFWATLPLTYTAEAYLLAAERSPDRDQRKEALRLAKSACLRATRHGRRVTDGSAADALRLNGTYAWLIGDGTKAERFWESGITVAKDFKAKLPLARLYHELGMRTGNPGRLETAELIFAEIGSPQLAQAPRTQQ